MFLELGAIPTGNGGEDGLWIGMELAEFGVAFGIVVEAPTKTPDHALTSKAQEVHPYGLRRSEIQKIRRSKNPSGSLSSDTTCNLIAFHYDGTISYKC